MIQGLKGRGSEGGGNGYISGGLQGGGLLSERSIRGQRIKGGRKCEDLGSRRRGWKKRERER